MSNLAQSTWLALTASQVGRLRYRHEGRDFPSFNEISRPIIVPPIALLALCWACSWPFSPGQITNVCFVRFQQPLYRDPVPWPLYSYQLLPFPFQPIISNHPNITETVSLYHLEFYRSQQNNVYPVELKSDFWYPIFPFETLRSTRSATITHVPPENGRSRMVMACLEVWNEERWSLYWTPWSI